MLFATGGYVFLPTAAVWANPSGEQVVGGSATFDRQGNTLTVNQATDRLAVNWQDFSIAAGEATHFNMPSSASIALNRVLGGNPSQIYGTLSSNGNIILVNNAGIFVGPGGVVNAASFVGSTLDIDPDQFMAAGAGGLHLSGDSYAPIVNQGNITAEKGDVFLIAQKVENRATISAPNGRAALVGAGRAADRTEVVLHEVGGSGFAVRVAQLEGEAAQGMNGDLPDGEELLNEGEISAAQAELSASGNIYALAIKNTGTIRAKAVVAQADGTVRLDGGLGDVQNTGTLIAKNAGDEATAAGGQIEVAGQNVTATPESIITAAGGNQGGNGGKVKIDSADTTIVQGKVDVAALSADAKGGKVELLGERVGLFEGAKVDASGGAGGGTVLAGGDYLGGNTPPPDLAARVALEAGPVKNAKATVMASTAEIKADATVSGDGGKVILWSDEYTGFYGQIFARGGTEGGDGGFVETSSARNLQAWGLVNASAPSGQAGTWLLDPDDITIVGGSGINNATNSGGSFTPLTNGATVGAGAIVAALTNGASVSVATTGGGTNSTGNGNIQVLAPINATLTAGQSASLTLSAAPGTGQISGSGDIGTAAGSSLNVTFNADSIASYSGAITTRGGSFTANTARGSQMSGAINSANGAVTINNTGAGAINLAGGGINAGNGAITITQSGAQNIILQGLTSAGVVSVTSQGGNITLNAANYNLTGATATFNANAGNFNLDGGGVFAGTTTATLNIRGNGGVTIDGALLTAGGTADININSDNGDISISGGVTGNNNISVAAGQNIRLSGTIATGIVGGAGTGIFSLRANGGAIQPIAGIGTVTPNPTTVTFIEAANNIRFNFGGDATFRAESTGAGNIQIEDASLGGTSNFTIGGNGIAGGAVTIRAGLISGTLTIAAGLIPNVRSASFQAQAGGGILFGLASSETFPLIRTAGLQQYDSAVTLFDDPLVPGASENWLAAGQILFNAVDSLGGPGTSSLGLSGTPAVTLNGLIGGVNALQNFTTRGGNITFGVFTTRGNPLLPPPLDLPVGPAINAVGTISMDSAQMILQQSTWLRAGNDLTFGGAVTGFRDGEFPVFQVDSDAGNIVFLQNVGTAAIPLGRLDVISGDQVTSTGGGEISLVGPVITVPGTTPIIPGGDGAVSLVTHSATKGIVITGGINTAGGVNYQNTMIGGPVTLSAVNANVQLQGNIVTRGGAIDVTGPAFFSGVSSLDTTTDGTTSGAITFNNTVDGLGGVVAMASGTSLLTFSGELGSISPFDLNVTSAGGITFAGPVLFGAGVTTLNSVSGPVSFQSSVDKLAGNIQATLGTSNLDFFGAVGASRPFSLQVNSSGSITMDSAVRMGGDFTFNGVTGPVAVNSTLDGTFGFRVNPVNDTATVSLGAVGGIVPVSFLTVGVGNSTVTLNGDITTAGGAINLGSPVILASSVNLTTTALGALGGAINFFNSLGGSGVEDLTITAGGGGLSFGGPVNQLQDLLVVSAGAFNFTAAADVTVTRDILITPQVTSGGNVTMTAGRNVTLTGGLLARQDPGPGANVEITATTGDINVGAIIEISARSGTFVIASPDGSSFTTVGTPGFNAGSLTMTGNQITVGAVNAIGSNNFVTGGNGGNGGTVTLNSAGTKTIGAINVSGGNGGPAGRAGSITLAGSGENRLSGNVTGNGGNGEAGSPGASGAAFDFSGQTVVIDGATVQITALGGSDSVGGGRGQDGNLTFGTLQSAASAQNNLLLNVGRGSITFEGQVGVDAAGTFGQITVVNALNVTFNDLLRTTRFVQNASVPDQSPYSLNSAGLTSFDEVILAGTGVAMELTGYNFTFGGPVDSTLSGGSIRVTNGGILAIRDNLTLGGNFTQSAAEDAVSARVEIGGNISTASGAITLASNARLVDLATITIDTGTGGGAITFGALLDSDATARGLVLNSGGTVTLNGLVGSLNPLASLETNAGGSLVLAVEGSDAVPSLNVGGGVVIRDQMSLEENTVVRSGSFALFNGGSIEGGQDLKFLVQGGSMILQGQVGGVTPLTSLWVEGANGGISLNFAGSELFPSVRTTAGQHYGSAVTLDSDNYLVSGGAMTFVNTVRAALNGGQGLTLNSGGVVRLQGLVGGGGLALSQLAVLGGGSLQFLANPGVDASVTTTGSQLYSSALLLGQDTSLLSTTSGDFDFTEAATINSLTLNQPRALTVNGQGKVVMEADLGGEQRLGAVNLGAVEDITVLGGLDTFGANVTMNSTAGTIVFAGTMTTGVAEQLGGNISLTAVEEIQLQGQLASRGGTVGLNAPVYLSGTSAIDTRSGGLRDGSITFAGTLDGAASLSVQSGTAAINFTGQVGYQSPFVLSVLNSGGVTFQQNAMLGSGSAFTTAAGNLLFQNLLDVAGGGSLTISQSPFDRAVFSGAVGSKNPFAMTLAAGGGITFEEAVVLGGTFNLATEGIGVEFLSTVDGAGSVVIQTSVGDVLLNGAIGGATPLGAGGLLISVGTGSTTIGGNITTEGGAVAIGNTVVLDADVEIFTGAGLITTGRSISFNKAITAPGGQSLLLDAGSSGGVLLGGSVGTAVTPLGSFTIRNGGGVAIGSSGGIFSDGNVLVNPELTGLFPKGGLTISSASGGITLDKGGVLTGQFREGNNNSDGSSLTMSAAGDIIVRALLDLSGGDNDYDGGGSGFSSGTLALVSTGGGIFLDTVQLLGGDANEVGAGGLGGNANIQAAGDLTIRQLLANGGDGERIVGGAGGNLTVVRTGASGTMNIGTVAALGGDSTTSFGGVGGIISLRADQGDLLAPTDFFVAGGEGSSDPFAGQGGQVTLEATQGNLSFARQTLNLDGDGSLRVVAGNNLILATAPDTVIPELSSGGVILNLNSGALRADRRGTMSFSYGSANNGGQFYMPSSSYLLSNGGDVAINVAATANLVAVGRATISGITTSGTSLNGGRILINQAPAVAGLVGDVSVLGTLETSGGTATVPTYGRTGGQVLVTGANVTLNKVITRGSDSLASATVPAFGGAGGDVSVTGTSITLRRDLDTSGGNGLGTGDANGGAGGQIQLFGNVILNSGSASPNRSTIVWNTQGGTLSADGDDGLGGNILVTGTLTGTPSTSNTLDLRYGSGTAILGDSPADIITLGTLITAADNTRSTGTLVLNGALDVGTLTTYARGYGIQINGGGAVNNAVTFNNTGNIALGSLNATTVFTGGLNASAPAAVRLQGTIESGDVTNPGAGAPMTFGVAELVGNTVLNSNGSNLSLGRIDGAFDLTFAPGIAAGVVDISSTVGASTRVGTITVSEGIVQPVTFRDSVRATELDGEVGTALSFFGNVDLTGSATLQGLTTLDNTLFESQNSTLDFLVGAASSLNEVVLASGPVRLTGAGDYTVAGTVTGNQTLKLAGAGAKNFDSTIGSAASPLGNGVAGIEQADGSGTVTFAGDVFTSGVSTFDGSVVLSSMTYTSADRVDFGGDVFDMVTLANGPVTLAGAGEKVFNGTVASTTGLIQGATDGEVTFHENVTSTGVAGAFNLAGDVEFAGMVLSSDGTVTLSGAVTLSEGQVTLGGVGGYNISATVNGAQNLVLDGPGTKSFTGALGGTVAIGNGSGAAISVISVLNGSVTLGAVNAVSGIASTASLVLKGDIVILGTGDTDSNFANTVTMEGINFSSTTLGAAFTGVVTLASGSSGAITTLGGTGAYQMLNDLEGADVGTQFLTFTSTGEITFGGTVGNGIRLGGLNQSLGAGGMEFLGNVFTSGASSFAGEVILSAMTFNADGTTQYNTVALAGGGVTLNGSGSQSILGVLTGNGFDLNLAGTGARSLGVVDDLGNLNIATSGTTTLGGSATTSSIATGIGAGALRLGGGIVVTTTLAGVNLNNAASITTLGKVDVFSAGDQQYETSLTLGGDFSANAGLGNQVNYGSVSGAGDMTTTADKIMVTPTTVRNAGTFKAIQADGLAMTVGTGGAFMDETSLGAVRSTGGMILETDGAITADTFTAGTGVTLKSQVSSVSVNAVSASAINLEAATSASVTSVTTPGVLGVTTGAGSLASFAGSSSAGSLILDAGTVGPLSSAVIAVPSLGGIRLRAAGDFTYTTPGNLSVTGPVRLQDGNVELQPSGNFVNYFEGNPFSANSTRILTRDFFSYPNSAGVPGLTPVYGVTSLTQLGANQIGVTLPLLAGSAAPFITEFTTGTGQPYILATQNNAVPTLMMPIPIVSGGGFATRVSYTQDELEMMTPAERSALEASQRQQSARVILQREGGGSQEIGLPAEGEIPQAKTTEPAQEAPTAQVILDGKPLAGKSEREKGDSTQLLRMRPAKAVALRSDLDVRELMENERLAAEVHTGTVPVAGK